MNLRFQPITQGNRELALSLKVGPGQETFVEPVAQCLREAGESKAWRPVGIYDDEDVLVGFAMYGRFHEEDAAPGYVWLDRLMIDQRFQGKGYGSQALKGLVTMLEREYGCDAVYLSIVPANVKAAAMYERFGFRFTGEIDPNGERVMKYSVPAK